MGERFLNWRSQICMDWAFVIGINEIRMISMVPDFKDCKFNFRDGRITWTFEEMIAYRGLPCEPAEATLHW